MGGETAALALVRAILRGIISRSEALSVIVPISVPASPADGVSLVVRLIGVLIARVVDVSVVIEDICGENTVVFELVLAVYSALFVVREGHL